MEANELGLVCDNNLDLMRVFLAFTGLASQTGLQCSVQRTFGGELLHNEKLRGVVFDPAELCMPRPQLELSGLVQSTRKRAWKVKLR